MKSNKYIRILKQRTLLDCKALYSMRHILKRNIEKGLLPNYQEGAVELDKQFCTIGGIGMYEVMDLFGLINTDEMGCKSYSEEAVEFATQILDTMNDVKDNFSHCKKASDYESLISDLEEILEEETEAYENLPESLQYSPRGEESQEAQNYLEDAICIIEDIIESINEKNATQDKLEELKEEVLENLSAF